MLAFLAAVVPITASLYVAGSMLLEYSQRASTVRIFERVWARANAERAAVDAGPLPIAVKNRLTKEISERRLMLFEANGLDPYLGTIKAANALVVPQVPPRHELRRQWSLLSGSALGVVFLAMDAITRGA